MSRKVIVNGESICYLPPTDASEIRFDMGGGNYSNVQTELEGKVSKSGDTMSGTLNINNIGHASRLYVGNDIPSGTTGASRGLIRLYSNSQYATDIDNDASLTADRRITLPDNSGVIALTSDFDNSFLPMSVFEPTTEKPYLTSQENYQPTDAIRAILDSDNYIAQVWFNSNSGDSSTGRMSSLCRVGSHQLLAYDRNNPASSLFMFRLNYGSGGINVSIFGTTQTLYITRIVIYTVQ